MTTQATVRVTNPKFNIENLSLDEMELLNLLLGAQNAEREQRIQARELGDKIRQALAPFNVIDSNMRLKLRVNSEWNSWSVYAK